uniref:Peptidase S54 rhomboid domain-containing protein n=1 Tax=Polytomella parva TaxID=51329 RepID=A0A7S0YNU5_9CHLO
MSSALLFLRQRSRFRFPFRENALGQQGLVSSFHSNGRDENDDKELQQTSSLKKPVIISKTYTPESLLSNSTLPSSWHNPFNTSRVSSSQVLPTSSNTPFTITKSNDRGFYTISNRRSNWMQYINDPDVRMTHALIAANLVAYALTYFDYNYFMNNFSLIPMSVHRHGEWYRLISSGFLHHGVLHLLGNMLSLKWLAPEVERQSGALRTALIYLASAAGGGYLHYLLGPPFSVTCGCSGSIAGFFGAYVMMKLQNRHFLGFGRETLSFIAQVIGINVVLSLLVGGSIAHWSHLGGLLAGSTFMFLFGPRFRWSHGYVEDQPRIGWFRNRS